MTMSDWLSQPENYVFLVIALPMVFGGWRVVTTRNVVHAALYLVLALGGSAALFLLLGAEFVAWTVVLVYIGAVVVLFLFGVMITRAPLGRQDDLSHAANVRIPAAAISFALFIIMGGSMLSYFGGEGFELGALAGDADCQVGTVLAGGTSCSFGAIFRIPAGDVPDSHVSVFTATVTDGDGNDETATDVETVAYADALPGLSATNTGDPTSVLEAGGDVEFTYVVTNNLAEAAEITVLTDDRFGTLAGDADCQVGTVLAGGTTCSFGAIFPIPAGDVPDSHVSVFTATVIDGDGNDETATDVETVPYADALPGLSVTNTGDPTSVLGTGGDVEFTYVVTNKQAEAAEITVLTDDQVGVTRTSDIGFVIFERFVIPFEVVSLVLLAALIGGIVLARKDPKPDDTDPAALDPAALAPALAAPERGDA